jgi:hypothetical protein
MLSRLKNYVLIAAVLAFFYYLLGHHFVFFGTKDFETLNKVRLTFKDTFTSVQNQTPEQVLLNAGAELRRAGLGELMVRRGLLTDEKLDAVMRKIENQ